MPTILEYSKAFSMLKRAVRLWCSVVGGWLSLDSYLLPTDKEKRNGDQRNQRDHQRQRARERMMRGDQEEQIGLLEALEAIEDDTTEEEEEEENGDGGEGEADQNRNEENNGDNAEGEREHGREAEGTENMKGMEKIQ